MGCSVARLVRLVDQAVDGESLVAVVGVVPFRAIATGLVLRLGVWPSGDLGGSALLLPGLLRLRASRFRNTHTAILIPRKRPEGPIKPKARPHTAGRRIQSQPTGTSRTLRQSRNAYQESQLGGYGSSAAIHNDHGAWRRVPREDPAMLGDRLANDRHRGRIARLAAGSRVYL